VLRGDRLSHHHAYAERYYAATLVPGLGLERVLDLLSSSTGPAARGCISALARRPFCGRSRFPA
jgi:hypothetical protein